MNGLHHPTGTRGQRQIVVPINFRPGPNRPCRPDPRPNGVTLLRTRRLLHRPHRIPIPFPSMEVSSGSCWPGPATECSDCRRSDGTGSPATPRVVERQLLVIPPGNFLQTGPTGVLQIVCVCLHVYGAPESIDSRPYPLLRSGPPSLESYSSLSQGLGQRAVPGSWLTA